VRDRLVGFDHVAAEACIDLFPAGEGDLNVHARRSQRSLKWVRPSDDLYDGPSRLGVQMRRAPANPALWIARGPARPLRFLRLIRSEPMERCLLGWGRRFPIMFANEDPFDRVARVALGLILLSLVVVGPRTLWGLVGLVPLLTGALGFCPLYRLVGVSTCRVSPDQITSAVGIGAHVWHAVQDRQRGAGSLGRNGASIAILPVIAARN